MAKKSVAIREQKLLLSILLSCSGLFDQSLHFQIMCQSCAISMSIADQSHSRNFVKHPPSWRGINNVEQTEFLLNFCTRSLCLGLARQNGSCHYSNPFGRRSKCRILGILQRSQLFSRKAILVIVRTIDLFHCLVRATNDLHWFCWTGCVRQMPTIIYMAYPIWL